MTDNPPSIPRSVIDRWVRASRVSTLSGSSEPVVAAFDEPSFETFNSGSLAATVGKARGEAIARVYRFCARAIKSALNHGALSYSSSLYFQVREFTKRRRALRELYSLPPEILRDIGLSQGDISAVEHGRIDLYELDKIRRQGWLD